MPTSAAIDYVAKAKKVEYYEVPTGEFFQPYDVRVSCVGIQAGSSLAT